MKHKLYNRLLSLALAVGLVVGMLPGAAAVDTVGDGAGQPVTLGNSDSGLELSKKLVKNTNGTYSIQLEAYATGEIDVSTEYKAVPTDIVLVLDQSGSMADPFKTSSTSGYQKLDSVYNTQAYSNRNNLYYYNGQDYIKVSVSRDLTWDGLCYTYRWNGQTATSYERYGSIPPQLKGNLYRYTTTTTTTTKQQALKDAVTEFVNSVQAQAQEDGVDHRISIVGFASDYTDGLNCNNTELLSTNNVVNYRNASNQNYKDSLVSVNSNGSVNSRLTTAIDRIGAEGGTAIDLGMEMAQKVLNNNPVSSDEERNQVVIVFTDGVPGIYSYNSEWEDTEYDTTRTQYANRAISYASDLKKSGVSVYSIGIFDGADADEDFSSYTGTDWDNSKRVNRFMHYLSSNYPNAQSMSNGGTPDEKKGYYLSAADADTLKDIFQKISDDIQTGGSSSTLDSNAIVRDVLTQELQLPEGTTANDITIETYKAANENTVTNPDAAGAWIKDSVNGITASIGTDGRTIDVTGFDFSRNFVADTGRVEGNVSQTGDFYGRKLVITIPVEPNPAFFGGNNINTNAADSGIYANEEEADPVDIFVSPNMNIPVRYAVSAKDQSIYITQNASVENMIEYVSGYQPDGWNNSHVTITYQVKDGDTVIGTYTIEPGATTGTWSGDNVSPEDCTNYTVTCTVTPNAGTNDSVNDPAVGAWTGSDNATVHVFTPTVTWQDSTQYKGTTLTANLLNRHNVSVTWEDSQNDGGATPAGNAPELSYAFKSNGQDLVNTTLENEINVQVEVTTGNKNITSSTNFEWEKGQACPDTCMAAPSNAQFRIHTYDLIEGQLTVTKDWQTDAGASVSDENVPFDKVEVTLEQYYMVGTGDNLNEKIVDSDTLVLTSSNGWTDAYAGIVQDYTLFRATEEKVYDGDKLIVTYTLNKETGVWTAAWSENAPEGSIYRDWDIHGFEFEREYESATANLNTIPNKNQAEFTISGGGVVVMKATKGDGSVIWMPYLDSLPDSDREAIRKAVIDSKVFGGGMTTANTHFFDEGQYSLSGATIRYNDNGTVYLNFTGQSTWAQFAYGGFSFGASTITNSLINTLDTDAKTQVAVTKVWNDDEYANRPHSVTVNLMNGAQEVEEVVLNDTNSWKHTFTNLSKYNTDGSLIEYTVTEDAVSGYTASITGDMTAGFTITNTRQTGSLTITKTVNGLDEKGLDELKDKISFVVKDNSDEIVATIKKGSEGWDTAWSENKFSYTLENLPTGTYTITESGHDNIANYIWQPGDITATGTVVYNADGTTAALTNTYTPADGYLKIVKKIEGGAAFNDGRDTFTFKVTAQSGKDAGKVWYFTIKGEGLVVEKFELPVGDYKVEELSNINYKSDYTVEGLDQDGVVTISNNNTETNPATVTFTNTPDKTDIPTDGGGVKNVPGTDKDGNFVWKPEKYGEDAEIVEDPETTE